jgi:hypothetical protein
MSVKPISFEIYTGSHRILGRLSPGASGLYSFLNIPTTSTLEIEGAHISRLHQPSRLVARYGSIWLAKQQIALILLSSRTELGATATVRRGYTTPLPQWVHVMLGGFELRGAVETAGRFNFGALMFEGHQIFIPYYYASMQAILFPTVTAESPAMLFNREMVEAIAMIPKDEIPAEFRTPTQPV